MYRWCSLDTVTNDERQTYYGYLRSTSRTAEVQASFKTRDSWHWNCTRSPYELSSTVSSSALPTILLVVFFVLWEQFLITTIHHHKRFHFDIRSSSKVVSKSSMSCDLYVLWNEASVCYSLLSHASFQAFCAGSELRPAREAAWKNILFLLGFGFKRKRFVRRFSHNSRGL